MDFCSKIKLHDEFSLNVRVKKLNVKRYNYLIVRRRKNLHKHIKESSNILFETLSNFFPNPKKPVKSKMVKILINMIDNDEYIKEKLSLHYKPIEKFNAQESSYISVKILKTLYTRRNLQGSLMFCDIHTIFF
jgi:hypothetical protein